MTDRNPAAEPSARAEEKRQFIIRRGIRGWAVPTGILVTLIVFVVVPVFMVHEQPDFGYLRSRAFFQSLLAALVLWPLGGWVIGAIEWRRNQRRIPKQDGVPG